MPWIDIAKPDAGEVTAKSFADAVVDDLNFLFSAVNSAADISLPNPSFEIDGDADGFPDEWTFTPLQNGSGVIVQDQVHGVNAFKMTRALGVGNGGGELETTDFFEVSEKRPLELQWAHYSSVAGIRDKVEVRFFDETQTFISTEVAYNSVANPTSWRIQSQTVTPPVGSRYAKLKITGGDTATNVAGDSFWDDFRVQESGSRAPRSGFAKAGAGPLYESSGNWVCPSHITRILVEAWGGGAGALSGANGGGGGAGQYVRMSIDVSPGLTYVVTIGAAGAAGSDGGNTTFEQGATNLLTAFGGTQSTGAGGGAGGTGGTNGHRIDGQRGRNAVSGSMGGAGGDSPNGGGGGSGTAGAGTAGIEPGGGGGGGVTSGAAGAKGRLLISY